MSEITLKMAKNEEDFKICDKFLEKLINYESNIDNIIMPNVTINNCYANSAKKENIYLTIAEYNEKAVGYVFAFLKHKKGSIDKKNIVFVEALYVDDSYRGLGIGKKLMNSVDLWAKQNFGNDYVIEVMCINNNISAMNFYKSLGYKLERTIFRKEN